MFLVPITPETQWLDNRSDPQIEDVARWRWTATASQRMRTQLQLSIVVRTMSADGSWIETVLPDQTVDVRIRAGLARSLGRWAGWLVPAVAGGVVTHLFGEALLAEAMSIITRFVGQS